MSDTDDKATAEAISSEPAEPDTADDASRAEGDQSPELDPAAFFALLHAPAEQPKKRRRLRAVLRWTSAFVVMGAVGAGTAFAVTLPRRTDIPSLATKPDGRYTFPGAAIPTLPAGMLAPGDKANKNGVHPDDLRQYLLAPPKDATVDPAFPGANGWYGITEFTSGFGHATELRGKFFQDGARRVAARGWTTHDGVHTTIFLVQFPDSHAARQGDVTLVALPPVGFDDVESVDGGPQLTVADLANAENVTLNVGVDRYRKVLKPKSTDPDAGKTGRIAHFTLGDTLVVIETVSPKAVTDVPTVQIVDLQATMLR